MALFPNPFNTLLGLQEALEAFRTSGWLQTSPSGTGSYPPINIFRKNDEFILIAEFPGINKSELDLQVKGRTVHSPAPRGRRSRKCQPSSAGTAFWTLDRSVTCRSKSMPMA